MSGPEMIDAGLALDLLCDAVRRHGADFRSGAEGGLIVAALRGTGLAGVELGTLEQLELRTLWVRGRLPCPMTLGAVAVLTRAQRAERAGFSWGVAVEHAAGAAQWLIGLVALQP